MSTPSGAVMGPLDLFHVDSFGVDWSVQNIDGWGAPAGTLAPVQRARRAGATAGDSFAKSRPMVIYGTAIAPDELTASLALDRLIDAASLADTVLTVSESGRERWCVVRRDGDVLPVWVGDQAFTYSVQVLALDSRKFGTPLSGSTKLPATVGGLTIPYTVPFSIGATSVSGQVSLTNPGNETGPVVLRIDGPTAGPQITHVGSGQSLIFASSLVLGLGEWLDIDMDARQALANGQSSRNAFITSRGWSGFTPGVNTWAFTATTFNAASQLTVTATPADK